MKKTVVLCTSLFAGLCISHGLQIGNLLNQTNALEYIVREKGPHHRKVERVETKLSGGQLHAVTNSYFELATGMHRNQSGELVAASSTIEILPLVGVVAQQTRHQVSFASTVGSANGTINLQTPDGKQITSSPLGIAYYDTATGQSVLIAELRPNVGAVLFPPDLIVYSDCFTDFKADLEYKNRLCGFEQNLVFQEQPPTPAAYGLNNDSTVIQLLTEFFDPPAVTKRSILREGMSDDAIIDFGEMKIVRGKSFMAGDHTRSVVVSKEWTVLSGRNFLIEQIPYQSIQPFLSTLPVHQQAGLLNIEDSVRHVVSTERLLPERTFSQPLVNDAIEVASTQRANEGFVLDYEFVGMSSDITLKGDTTYYVSGPAYLSGTNILEGGAVIKFNPDDYSQLVFTDELKCQTSPYRPAFFTSRDDNSVGEIIPGSTGNPSTNYYYPGVGFNNFDHVETDLSYCRFRYSGSPLEYDNYPTVNKVRHCQFLDCTQGVSLIGLYDVYLQNVLMDHVNTPFVGIGFVNVEHLTVDGADYLASGDDMILQLKNSLLVSVTNIGTLNCNETNDNFIWLTNDPGVFETVGAGSHYLATNSPYRDVGTNDISSGLLTELASKTTYSPTVLTSDITSDTTLAPTAARDTNTLDLGYHYDALDYAINANVTNATLTLTNGVGVAVFGTTALGLQSGSKLESTGSPLALNHLVRYQCVQEQSIFWSGTNVATINAAGSNADVYPSIHCSFTEMIMPSLESDWSWLCVTTGAGPTNVVCRDSLIWNGKLQLDQGTDRVCSIAFDNSLFHRVKGQFSSLTGATTDYSLHLGNDLFYGGTWQLYNDTSSTNWSIHNNAFDGVTLDSVSATPNSHNAYIATASLDGSSGNDVTLSSFVYEEGALGGFYHGQSDLADAGDTTADALGLFHYTTTADQTKENDTTVDIGFHYIAVDSNGNPVDTDTDGSPDYLEDANGNGVTDGAETSWE